MKLNASDYLVLSVSGLPLTRELDQTGGAHTVSGPAGPDILTQIKQATKLERNGKKPIQSASVAVKAVAGKPTLIFAFDQGSQPIQIQDKEVTFVTKVGSMSLKARFELKNMIYQGKLAI